MPFKTNLKKVLGFLVNYSIVFAWFAGTWSICGWQAKGWAMSMAVAIVFAHICYFAYHFMMPGGGSGNETETDSEQG